MVIIRPRHVYERMNEFFENLGGMDLIIQLTDNKIYEKYGVSDLIASLLNVAKNDDKDGVVKAIRALLSHTR